MPRHALVVASQCDSMLRLERLDEAAAGLEALLLDPALGGFRPALPDGRARLLDVDLPDLRAALGQTFEYAADAEAVLCLAFLGHGFIPGDETTLYFMGPRSRASSTLSALNIGEVLVEAAAMPGIAGVIALLDTCHAAAGTPDFSRLSRTAGSRPTSLSVLSGTMPQDLAYDMDLSFRLVEVLRAGLVGPAEKIYVDHGLADRLRELIDRQDISPVLYDQTAPMWLARNAAHGVHGPADAGYALEDLRRAVGAWRPGYPVPSALDEHTLRQLRVAAAESSDTPARSNLLRVLSAVQLAHRTAALVRVWVGATVTSGALRRAFAAVDGPAGRASGREAMDVGSMLEFVALNQPLSEPDVRRWLVRYVVVLLSITGRDLTTDEQAAWGQAISADALVAAELGRAVQRRREDRLRLIITLESETDDWPESLNCWLLDGPRVVGRTQFACRAALKQACQEAIEDATEWGERLAAEEQLPLRRIEVAVPATLLYRWPAEESRGRHFKLGVQYEVVVRWNGRLKAADFARDNRIRTRLATLAAELEITDGSPVSWLSTEQARTADLRAALDDGRYPHAVGLMRTPNRRQLELLLSNLGIVIWPRQGERTADHESAVDRHWSRLPLAFLEAYRASLCAADRTHPATDAERDSRALSQLRAVWDDMEWLDFGAMFHGRNVAR